MPALVLTLPPPLTWPLLRSLPPSCHRGADPDAIIGLMLIKDLLHYWRAPRMGDQEPHVRDLRLRPMPAIPVETPMFDVLNLFQVGGRARPLGGHHSPLLLPGMQLSPALAQACTPAPLAPPLTLACRPALPPGAAADGSGAHGGAHELSQAAQGAGLGSGG
jgi:hypothetical protein